MIQEVTLDIHKQYWWTSNAERRMHWAVRAEKVRIVREMAHVRSRRLEPMEKAAVTVTACYPSRRHTQDVSNIAGTVSKAVIDGIVTDAGVLPDDDSDHVVAVTYRRGPDTGKPGWYRLIVELQAVE